MITAHPVSEKLSLVRVEWRVIFKVIVIFTATYHLHTRLDVPWSTACWRLKKTSLIRRYSPKFHCTFWGNFWISVLPDDLDFFILPLLWSRNDYFIRRQATLSKPPPLHTQIESQNLQFWKWRSLKLTQVEGSKLKKKKIVCLLELVFLFSLITF